MLIFTNKAQTYETPTSTVDYFLVAAM
jgi:hypothetical protein